MEEFDSWLEKLEQAEEQIAAAHTVLAELQSELKDAGRKKDMMAIAEVVDRLARYGRLFEDIRSSWTQNT